MDSLDQQEPAIRLAITLFSQTKENLAELQLKAKHAWRRVVFPLPLRPKIRPKLHQFAKIEIRHTIEKIGVSGIRFY